uniref:Si:dkey-4p15.5 n=1 Tax=Oryzias sinensis TaxID=183150 RepID=A0A8C7X2F4_9TELE
DFRICYIIFHVSKLILVVSTGENADINVTCGTQYMDLSIFLCPMYQALYNESLMVVNNQLTNKLCYGKADWSVSPPVLRFRFPINETDASAYFSKVQFVNISGMVNSIDPSAGAITYRPQILYKFSCNYPMQYLLNNTQIGVSGVNIAIRDNNGSFISTLSMQLYQDAAYTQILTVPPTGLNLKTKIYVNVKATNLTDRFNLLLDRCYATTSPYPIPSSYYDLFLGCSRDAQTKIELNGVSQTARFSFEAFRFVEHKNLTVSTFYLHCATRLCEASTCASLLRRRAAEIVPTNTTITSPPIFVGKQSVGASLRGKKHHPYFCFILYKTHMHVYRNMFSMVTFVCFINQQTTH